MLNIYIFWIQEESLKSQCNPESWQRFITSLVTCTIPISTYFQINFLQNDHYETMSYFRKEVFCAGFKFVGQCGYFSCGNFSSPSPKSFNLLDPPVNAYHRASTPAPADSGGGCPKCVWVWNVEYVHIIQILRKTLNFAEGRTLISGDRHTINLSS